MQMSILFLALLWLVFAVAHEAFTGRIWFWVLPGMAPPILFAIVPLMLLLAAIFCGRFRAPMFAVTISSLWISSPSMGINFFALKPQTKPLSESSVIHVIQMNTDYWGQLREGTLTDPRNKEDMLSYLRSQNADVYLLQEHMSRVGDFAPPVTDLSDIAEIFPEYEAVTAGTLLTLSRLPVTSRAIVNPNSTSDIHLPPPPYVLRVDVQINRQILSTYNVHMPIQIIIEKDWFSRDFYFEIWRRHFIRADEYDALLRDVSNNSLPLVIAGDFNTSPAMGDNRRLLDSTQDAVRFSNILYPATWRVGGQLPRLWRNDWFLIRNSLVVNEFRSIDPEGNSDHLVQSVRLSLPQS